MTRDELFNLMDSPTVAAIARVFDPQYQRPGQSYSEQIVSILEASLALRSQGANAETAVQWLWKSDDGGWETTDPPEDVDLDFYGPERYRKLYAAFPAVTA
jgi:hypothetical protein